MKKFLSGMIAALLMAAGLVAFSGQSAQAACGDQYTPCVATKTKPKAKPVDSTKKPVVEVQVTANGNVKPVGVVEITVNGKTYTANYKGGKIDVKLPKLKPGKYKVKVTFVPAKVGNFEESSKTITLTVKKPKKR